MTMCLHAWLLLSVSVVTDKGMKLGKISIFCPQHLLSIWHTACDSLYLSKSDLGDDDFSCH